MTGLDSLRVTGPEDLLALVPILMGFHPDQSMVVLTVGGATQPVHARVDLPQHAHHMQEADELAAHLAAVARRAGVTSVAVVVYTTDCALSRTVVDALVRSMTDARVHVACVVRSDGVRWWSVHEDGEWGGEPYDVSSHPLVVRSIVDGTVVLGSRQQLADSLRGDDPGEVEEISRLAEVVGADVAAATRSGAGTSSSPVPATLQTEGRWLLGRVRRFLRDGERLGAADVARLAALVTAQTLRDLAWAEITRENAARHVDLWRDVVSRVPVHLRAAPAGLLGFSAWLTGNGALAWCAVECAEEADAGSPLAGLLTQVLAGAVPPSAWQPPDRPQLRPSRLGSARDGA
jgi:hypothetical protein